MTKTGKSRFCATGMIFICLGVAQCAAFTMQRENGRHATTVARRCRSSTRAQREAVRSPGPRHDPDHGRKALVAKANERKRSCRPSPTICRMDGQLAGSCVFTFGGLGTHWVPDIGDFQTFPILRSMLSQDRSGRPIDRKTDISITIVSPPTRALSLPPRKLAFSLFASREYLRLRGPPATIANFLAITDLSVPSITPIRCSTGAGLVDATTADVQNQLRELCRFRTQAGFGIALGPSFYRKAVFDLVRLEIELPFETELWLVSHEETNRSARVRAVGDFLKARFAQDRLWWRG